MSYSAKFNPKISKTIRINKKNNEDKYRMENAFRPGFLKASSYNRLNKALSDDPGKNTEQGS